VTNHFSRLIYKKICHHARNGFVLPVLFLLLVTGLYAVFNKKERKKEYTYFLLPFYHAKISKTLYIGCFMANKKKERNSVFIVD